MNKVAIAVQRCHESVVGGSETLAWQYATLLKDAYDVEVLTTTAVDAAYWGNALPEGVEVSDGINIRRFHVDIGYSPYRSSLFDCLLKDFDKFCVERRQSSNGVRHLPWSIALQEELIRNIGPFSDSLVRFIRERWSDYRTIIFITYLYPTTYFGLLEVPPGYALFAPTLHDEPPAYLSAYQHAARRAGSVIWLSEGERRLGSDLWGSLPGPTIGTYIEATLRGPIKLAEPYLLYCGRIDPNKGCDELFQYFMRFKQEHPGKLHLVLTGKDDIAIPDHPDIEFRGFVSPEEKFRLMAGAALYMMPSGKESFSIVMLEAMAQRTPVLASGACEVTVDHLNESGGGLIYSDYESFSQGLHNLLSDESARRRMGDKGREYVTTHFTPERIREALIDAIESCATAFHAKHEASTEPIPEPAELTSEKQRISVMPKSGDISYAPAISLPAGWSEEQLQALVTSIRVEDGPDEEMKSYARGDFKRFIYTLGLVPEKFGMSVLELGANPYFTTTLLHKFRNAELHLANFFGRGEQEGSQKVTIHETGEVISYSYKQFNIEEDAFPYENETFDVVMFCEIIEHLLSDPIHALAEIRRVLKPGGVMVLTTPNAARLENVRKIVVGENIYDPYSGYGPYGRHNREYTQQDVFRLLDSNGFHVDVLFTADVNEVKKDGSLSERIDPLVRNRKAELGQYIFCRGSVDRESKTVAEHRPEWLYRSMSSSS